LDFFPQKTMKTISITSQFSVFGSLHRHPEHDGTGGCEKRCTYSKFRVGAALLLDNGQTVLGSNQENAAYPFRPLCRTCSYFRGAIYPEEKLKWLLRSFRLNKTIAPIPPAVLADNQLNMKLGKNSNRNIFHGRNR
jgi:cytidine deaminase